MTAHSVRVVAHRGDPWSQVENTLASVRAAVAAGADVVEVDARVTRDDVAVVVHDATLARLWNLPRRVADTSAAEVAALGIGSVAIPTLAEVLDAVAGTGVAIMVDLPESDGVATIIRTVADGVARHASAGADLSVIWSGEAAALHVVRQLLPDAVIITHAFPADPSDPDGLRPLMVNLDVSTVTREDIERAHTEGLGVSVWTVDDAPTIRRLAAWRVDSITTNRVALARAVLAEEPPPEIDDPELRLCRDVAVHLAETAIRMQRSAVGLQIETKKNAADLVTDVDRAMERLVREVIAAELPGHLVVGEEYGGEPGPGPTWYCDPVDGTTNFANGLRWSSFSLSLVRDDRYVVGAVADTITGEVGWAVAGHGTVVADRLITTAPTTLPGGVVLIEPAGDGLWAGQAELIARLATVGAATRMMGSGTLALALPAAGRGAAGVVHHYNPIDHGASTLIALEAGCELLDFDFEPVPATVSTLRERGVVVAAPGVAAELRALPVR